MKNEEKYLTPREQMKLQLIRDEIDMLNKKISRTTRKREELRKKVDKIVSRVDA